MLYPTSFARWLHVHLLLFNRARIYSNLLKSPRAKFNFIMVDPTADLPFAGQLKILLPPLGPKAVPLMSEVEVKKIPHHLLTWLRNEASQVQDLGELTVITVSNKSHHLMIRRVVQWITRGEEAPFFSNDKPKVTCDGDSQAVLYNAKVHDNDTTCRATAETRTSFDREAELYCFSVIAGMTDVRITLSKRLSSLYPVHVAEIATLFKRVYTNGIYTAFDPELVRFIWRRIDVLKEPLAKDDQLLEFLRGCFRTTDKIKGLLVYMHGNPDEEIFSDRAVEHIFKEVGKTGEAKALIATFVDKYLKIPADPAIDAPTGPADRRKSDNHIGDAMSIFQAIYSDDRIVVSDENGKGVLRSSRSCAISSKARPNDFRVSRGEILVMLPKEGSEIGESSSQLVCNRYGDVGELSDALRLISLRDLRRKAPIYSLSFV